VKWCKSGGKLRKSVVLSDSSAISESDPEFGDRSCEDFRLKEPPLKLGFIQRKTYPRLDIF